MPKLTFQCINKTLGCVCAVMVFFSLLTFNAVAEEKDGWIVYGNEARENETIILNGNLTIYGNLTFVNVSLQINCSYDGEFGIFINENASFVVENSTITSLRNYTYKFLVYGKMELFNSSVSDVYGDLNNPNGKGGIEIYSNNVLIENSKIFNCTTNGIFANNSSPKIINNEIFNNSDDGIELNNSSAEILGNEIKDNGWGIVAFYSTPLIANNSFENIFGRGNNSGDAIALMHSNATIQGNKISNCSDDGITIEYSSSKIVNNTINSCNGSGIIVWNWFENKTNFVLISKNSIYNNTVGIDASGTFPLFADVENNTIFDNAIGISTYGLNLTLKYNKIFNNSKNGIVIVNSNSTITNNEIFFNGKNGISVHRYIYDINEKIFNNTIGDNKEYGIVLNNTKNAEFENNTFEYNGKNNSRGKICQAWLIDINIKYQDGDFVEDANITIKDSQNNYINKTLSYGSIERYLTEYIIDNNDTKIDYNPYTITAKKEKQENKTTIVINESKDITIHLSKGMDLEVRDLYISSSYNLKVGDRIKISAVIFNHGDKDVENVKYGIYANDETIDSQLIFIQKNSSKTIVAYWYPKYSGNYGITVVVKGYDKSSNEYNETDETNNVAKKEVYVYGKETPYIYNPTPNYEPLLFCVFGFIIIAFFILFVFYYSWGKSEGNKRYASKESEVQIKEKKWYNFRQLYLTRKLKPQGADKLIVVVADIVLWFLLLPIRILYLFVRILSPMEDREEIPQQKIEKQTFPTKQTIPKEQLKRMYHCNFCGDLIPIDSKKCPYCGKNVR